MKIEEIDLADIKGFVHRERDKTKFEQIKQSIAEIGLRMPIQVRDISHWKPEDRKRPKGGHYKYELIVGEGRCRAFRELGLKKIPAEIVKTTECEIVGRFLAENVLRKNIPWHDKAKLIKADIDAGMDAGDVAKRYFITQPHLAKLMRIAGNASPAIEKEIRKLTVDDAEKLTQLETAHQNVVVEVLKEKKLGGDLRAVVQKAMEVAESGELSKTALLKSIERIEEDLKRIRDALKPVRLHFIAGPVTLERKLRDPKFKALLDKYKVPYRQFEEAMKEEAK